MSEMKYCDHVGYKTYPTDSYRDNGDEIDDKIGRMVVSNFANLCHKCEYVSFPCDICSEIKQIIFIPGNLSFNEVFCLMPEIIEKTDKDFIENFNKEIANELYSESHSESEEQVDDEKIYTDLDKLLKIVKNYYNDTINIDISSLNLYWMHINTRITGHDGGMYFILKCNKCNTYTIDTDK